MVRLWFLLSCVAVAYDWGGSVGSTTHYHIDPNSFTNTEITEIDAGFAAWNAGAGEVLRGADMTIIRDADRTNTGLGNANNEVYVQPQSWFDNKGVGSWTAGNFHGVDDTDIVFNGSVSWCTDTPSSCASGTSIGQTAEHEMGHRVGFNHEGLNIATMNHWYPHGGDISDTKYRINEDDSVGLQDNKSDSSTGRDLMLSRFAFDAANSVAVEKWTLNLTYTKSTSSWSPGPPANVLAIIEGTSTQSPSIEWHLVPSNENCFDNSGTEYTVGTATPTISPNLPFSLGPSAWTLGSVSSGTYTLCAKIDPDDLISETADGDNGVRGEGTITVQP